MAEESHTYVCPISSHGAEEPLLAQLLKCKGKLDSFAINCLKEMLSLMAKEEHIARYIYYSAPHTYQVARYSDWIRLYIEFQKSEVERSNSFGYFKAKYDAILKSLDYINRFELHFVEKFKQEDMAALENLTSTDETFKEDVLKDWLAFNHNEVIEHFPPQLVIGKQTADDVDYLVVDEDPLVKVVLSEVACEYNYSNPTSLFNLSIPHVEIRSNNFTTVSYRQYKTTIYENEKRQEIAQRKAAEKEAKEKAENAAKEEGAEGQEEPAKDPQEEEVVAP